MRNRYTSTPTKVDRRLVMYVNLTNEFWLIPEPTSNVFYGVSVEPLRGSRRGAFNALKESSGWNDHMLPALQRIARSKRSPAGQRKVLIYMRAPLPRGRRSKSKLRERDKIRWNVLKSFKRWLAANHPELSKLTDGDWIQIFSVVN